MKTGSNKLGSLLPHSAAAFSMLASAALWALAWRHLPDPLATHFSFSGAPDGATSKGPFVLTLAAVLAIPLALQHTTRSEAARTILGAMVLFCSSLVLLLTWSITSMNWGQQTWQEAPSLPFLHPLLVALVPLLLSAWFLAHCRAHLIGLPERASVPQLDLKETERIAWWSTAKNPSLPFATLPLICLAVLTARWGPSYVPYLNLVIAVVVFVLLDTFSVLAVSVDAQGVHLRYGRLGWFRKHHPLQTIQHAVAFELNPLSHGGWGYRGSLLLFGRAAVVIRAGSALRLTLKGNRRLAITVDDAEIGAQALNGLIARQTGDLTQGNSRNLEQEVPPSAAAP